MRGIAFAVALLAAASACAQSPEIETRLAEADAITQMDAESAAIHAAMATSPPGVDPWQDHAEFQWYLNTNEVNYWLLINRYQGMLTQYHGHVSALSGIDRAALSPEHQEIYDDVEGGLDNWKVLLDRIGDGDPSYLEETHNRLTEASQWWSVAGMYFGLGASGPGYQCLSTAFVLIGDADDATPDALSLMTRVKALLIIMELEVHPIISADINTLNPPI